MKYCPECRNRYPDDLNFCLVDRGRLVASDPDAETLKNEIPIDQSSAKVTLLVKTQTVKTGGYVDFSAGKSNTRIILKGIEEAEFPTSALFLTKSKLLAARVEFRDLLLAICAPGVKGEERQQYLLPVSDEESQAFRSIYFFYLKEDGITMYRIFVSHINNHSNEVELNLGYFQYKA